FHPAAGLPNLPAAVALRARRGGSHHAAAVAIGTGIKARDVQAHHRAADRFPETDIDLVFQIGAALRFGFYGCAAAPAAKDAGENIAEAATTARTATSAAEIGKVKAAEVETLAASAARRRCPETACAKAATTRIGFRRCGIDIV